MSLRAAIIGLVVALLSPCLAARPAWTQAVCSDLWATNGSVSSVAMSGNTLYIAGTFTEVASATGGAVPIDAATGQPLAVPRVKGTVYAVAPDGAGGWFLGGSFTHVNGYSRSNIARLRPDLSLDDWNPGASGQVNALAVSGTTLYVAGIFTSIGSTPRLNLAALNAATGNVLAWNPGCSGAVSALALSGDGTIVYVGGSFHSPCCGQVTIGGQARNYLAAVEATTGFATGWNPDANLHVLSLAVSGTNVYAGGQFSVIGGQSRNRLAAVDAISGTATAWNPNANSSVLALAVGGTALYAGGSFSVIGGQARSYVAALDATTGAATPWNPGANAPLYDLVLSGSTVYAGGQFATIGGQPRSRIAALDAVTGAVSPWNPKLNGDLRAIAVDLGTVFAGGTFTTAGGVPRNRLAALDLTTGAPTPWNPGANGDVRALAVNGTTVYAGGSFSQIGGQSRNYLAAIDGTTGAATAWNPNPNNAVTALAVNGTTIYAGGYFRSSVGEPNIGGQARNHIAALDATTGAATAWDPSANRVVTSLLVDGATVYAGGAFSSYQGFQSIGGQPRDHVAALDAVTGAATPWDPSANDTVFALAVSGATVYAGGRFTSIGGQARNRLAALDAAGGAATPWNPSPNNFVTALAVSGATVYAGGRFTSIGGQPRDRIAALDGTTGAVRPWWPNADAEVLALVVDGTSVFAGGSFSMIANGAQRGIVCLVQPPQTLAAPEPEDVVAIAIGEVHPNPTAGEASFLFELPRSAHVRIAVFDLQGREVMRVADGEQPAGRHVATWHGDGSATTGMYFVRFEADGYVETRRFIRIQ